MKWGAHLPLIERVAAKHAIKIRAALLQSVDANKVVLDYLHTHPIVGDNPAQDKARARAWAMYSVNLDSSSLRPILSRIYGENYVIGQASAEDYVYRSVKARKSANLTVDWSTWQPGNRTAAALVSPSGGLKGLLDRSSLTIKSINQTTYDVLGNTLANGLSKGLPSKQIASMINDALGSTPRALTIARTEGTRASNAALTDTYSKMGVETVEWSAVAPDKCICVDLDGEQTNLGEEFPSGDGLTQPPAHPNCVCTLIAIIPDNVTLDSLSNYSNSNGDFLDGVLAGSIGTGLADNGLNNTDNGEGDTYATFAPDRPSKPKTKALHFTHNL